MSLFEWQDQRRPVSTRFSLATTFSSRPRFLGNDLLGANPATTGGKTSELDRARPITRPVRQSHAEEFLKT